MAYEQSAEYVSLLQGSYNPFKGWLIAKNKPFRQGIINQQPRYEFGGSSLTGPYEYSFDNARVAFLRLKIYQPPSLNFGQRFLAWYQGDYSDHAGVMVWDNNGNVFIFEPNCGGVTFTTTHSLPMVADWVI